MFIKVVAYLKMNNIEDVNLIQTIKGINTIIIIISSDNFSVSGKCQQYNIGCHSDESRKCRLTGSQVEFN